jgi:hypothetical protein
VIDARAHRSEKSAAGRDPQPHTLPASNCNKALIELCARIWWELERLANWRDCATVPGDPTLELLSETLRLELVLIVDSCESASWMLMQDIGVRRCLSAMSKAVLSLLAVSPTALTRRVIECAQDRVFDEALNHYDLALSEAAK